MSGDGFDWKGFQQQMGYTDDELQMVKSDLRRVKATERMALPEWQNKYLIIEVVSSENCPAQMKPGDRLFFKACTIMEPGKSDPWCVLAMNNFDMMAAVVHDKWVSGLDPADMDFSFLPCVDCGVKNGGWGRVVMKAYVKDESEL